MPAFMCFSYTVSKTAVISPNTTNLTQKCVHGVQLDFLHRHTKFYPVQSEGLLENEANGVCFVPTLSPPVRVNVSECGIKW